MCCNDLAAYRLPQSARAGVFPCDERENGRACSYPWSKDCVTCKRERDRTARPYEPPALALPDMTGYRTPYYLET